MADNEPTPHPIAYQVPSTMNTNTYVSLGLVALVLGGFVSVIVALYSAKGEITTRLDKVEWRMGTYETKTVVIPKETWNDVDMFKWAVRLQRENADPKKLQSEGLKVPEPEHTKEPTP